MPLQYLGSKNWNDMVNKAKAEISKSKFGASPDFSKNFGLESLDPTTHLQMQTQFTSAAERVLKMGKDSGLIGEDVDVNHPGVRAASIIASSCEDITQYTAGLTKHNNAAINAGNGVVLRGRLSGTPVAGIPYAAGLEAFDNAQELKPNTEYSIAYNLRAAKQDDAAELLFPTTSLEASDVGVRFEIPIPLIEDYIEHTGGNPTNWKRRRLIDAGRDGKMLITDATKLIPWKKEDGSVDEFFVDETLVPAKPIKARDEEINTAPLLAGEYINLLGLCATPGLVGKGVVDGTYVIDAEIKLVKAYLKITNGSTTSIVAINTSALQMNAFQKSQEGDSKLMTLNLQIGGLPLDKVKQVDGTDAAALADLTASGNVPYMRIFISGSINVEGAMFGLTVNKVAGRIQKVLDDQGNEISMDTGAIATAAKATKIELLGFDLDSRVRNSNLAQRGKRVDIKTVTRMYLTRIGEPLSAISPGVDSFGPVTGIQVETLANATYMRNSALAIFRALDYFEQVKSFQSYGSQDFEDNALEGVGNYFVDPVALDMTLDFAAMTSTTNSAGRVADITATITNSIREIAYKLNALSGYGVALNFLHPGEKVKVNVVTDNYIAQFIQVFGDLRTMGISFDFSMAISNLNEMRGKIFVTLSRGSSNSVDPLTFGMHAWIPEVVSRAKMNRGGPYAEDLIVQPRNIHIPIVPVMAMINFTGMPELYTGRLNLNVNVEKVDTGTSTNSVVDNSNLNGLTGADAGQGND